MILSKPMTRGRRDAPAALFLYAVFCRIDDFKIHFA